MNFDIPVIILKNLIILPNQEIKLELNNTLTNKTITDALSEYNGEVLVVCPTDLLEEEPSVTDLPKVGVVAKIKNKLSVEESIHVKLKGIKRVAINKYFYTNGDILYGDCLVIDLPSLIPSEEKAIEKKLISSLEEYINMSDGITNAILSYVKEEKSLDKITDAIASFLPFPVMRKLDYMEEINPLKRAKYLITDIEDEIASLMLDHELESKMEENLTDDQRKYLLKEKLRAIKDELGENSWKDEEIGEFETILDDLKISSGIKKHIEHEISKYAIMNESSPEVSVLHNYLDLILNLPWNKESKEVNDYNKVLDKLNETHYGLDDIKTRIAEYVAIKKLNKDMVSPVICLVGPPGVGKTSIAMSIANALNRKFIKISVGGLNDSTELVGTRKTYLASQPGKIIEGIKRTGTSNPLILIDEVDKMVHDYKGDPASTLLEILDPVQNKLFNDNYLEVPFDLSHVLFILTANNIESIPVTILDRVEVINLNSYTLFEKLDIAKKYIIPRILKENMVDSKFKIKDEVIEFIIENYTSEAGVRELERILSSLARKITLNKIKSIDASGVVKLLGNPKYNEYDVNENTYGVVNTLAYTPLGGKVSKVEVLENKGNGKVIITGNAGDILNESVTVAITLVKNKYKFNLNNIDLHFHFLELGIKKDGPSAGLNIVIALISLLEKRVIDSSIAFTGEISLNGSILKVGGLKEKLIGAYNKGIKVVYIPFNNIEDLDSLPKIVRDNIDIIPVKNIDEAYTKIFK